MPSGRGGVLEDLRQRVLDANVELFGLGLAPFTWGNASGRDPESGLVAVKPSGVAYRELTAGSIVVVDLHGAVVEGELAPSTDTPSHLAVYRAWGEVCGVAHTHSTHATAFAQALRGIPCLGTTHADHFRGPVPVTDLLTDEEIASGYERATGVALVRLFERSGLDPLAVPAALSACHGPFAWGRSPEEAVRNAAVLEECARTAALTLALTPGAAEIPRALLDKHFTRKHGPGAYYGQRR
jgi:L-ribulose-5-phosphate 4-epimerase